MSDTTNTTERDAAIKAAAEQLALTLTAEGYNPRAIGTAFADALMENIPCEEDLGQECFALIISTTIHRLNEHFNRIQSRKNTL